MTQTDISLFSALLYVITFLMYGKYLARVNLLSVFWFSTLGLNAIALFVWSVSPEYFLTRLPDFDFQNLTSRDFLYASIIVNGGAFVVSSVYVIFHIFLCGGRIKPQHLLGDRRLEIEPISDLAFRILGIGLLAFGSGLLSLNLSNVGMGAVTGFLEGNYLQIMDSRQATGGSSYLSFVFFVNVLPMSTMMVMLQYRATGNYRPMTYALVGLTVLGLLFSFTKTSLIIFVLLASLTAAYVGALAKRKDRQRGPVLNPLKIGKYFTLVFVLLMSMYYLFGIGRQVDNNLDVMLLLADVASSRVIARLGLSTLLYAHYFPNIGDFYGLTNSGLITNLLDVPIFRDTNVVFEHFTGMRKGSVAINATVDFYGAFGWTGWLVGCTVIGMILATADYLVSTLKNSPINFALQAYLLVFSFYLTQASLFRSSLGYGGLFFVCTWLVFRLLCVVPSHEQKKRIAQQFHEDV